MKIKRFAFGDKNTAFVEERFGERVNIIFSDDNNKGKTLLLQGIMYAMGNEPIFPAGFDSSKYYFYLQLDFNNKNFEILRKNNTFSIIMDGILSILESESEFKYFFDRNIFKLPEIVHRGVPKIVDLSLFLQIFFVGQDKRDTSKIFNSGYYNKSDFIEMLYALNKVSGIELSSEQIYKLKNELKQCRIVEAKLSKEIDRYNINKAVLTNVKSSSSYKDYKAQEALLKKLNDRLNKLHKQRYSERTRLNKNVNLKAELNSLNRAINVGQVSCDDCGSGNITYKSKDISFDISNKSVRESILHSVDRNIIFKQEIISRIDFDITELQTELHTAISQVSPQLRDIILFQDELESVGSLDSELTSKQRDIETLTQKLKDSTTKQDGLSEQQNQLLDGIVQAMNSIYKIVDEKGTQTFIGLFTKKTINYSGSEEQEFYFAKLYALYTVLGHDFPIIIDSFRDRELSTSKEVKMIEVFESIEKQVIVTATLKKEEYSNDKYETYGAITALDYSSHENGRILTDSFRVKFTSICQQFGISNL